MIMIIAMIMMLITVTFNPLSCATAQNLKMGQLGPPVYKICLYKAKAEWPKMVSEVSFPRFWGIFCIEKWSQFFVSVIGSAVSEIS